MSFLTDLWAKLKDLKIHQRPNKKVHIDQVFKGYRAIPIQELPLIKTSKKALPSKKTICEFQGCKTIFYQETTKGAYQTPNGFFHAFYDAYINHGQVKISPDDVWMTILQWFAAYAHKHHNILRKKLTTLDLQGKLSIKVFQELKQSQMEEVYDSILLQIRKSAIQGIPEKIESIFSTSTKLEKLYSASIIANHALQSKKVALQQSGGVFGIQRVHMGGRIEDWQRLIWKLGRLVEFDVDGELKLYIEGLKPVLEQFLETYKGFPHIQFWNSICQQKFISQEVAATHHLPIDGWLIRFFTTHQTLDQFSTVKIAVHVVINRANTQKYKQTTLMAGCRGVSLEKNVYRPQFTIFLVTDRLGGVTEKTQKTIVEEPVKPKLERRENSKSLNHQNLQTRPKTTSFPRSMKMAERTAIDFHGVPHTHLREEMKVAKINMGEIFQQSIYMEMPEIHMKNKTNIFAHPYRHA